ncbi:CpsD/CapB family tyrosine-protein kinase [Paenibacillus montanisoli]|nr:CpsD/CapB family tyrosine-protein kinase [Paenibacillus montanisoli]
MLESTNKIVTLINPDSIVAESYRLLSTNIQFTSPEMKMKVILVTSASPGEGKTTIAANLAVTFAQDNKKVLLIDANLRKPMLHEMFRNSNAIGLTTILNNTLRIENELLHECTNNLFLLPSGPILENPSALLSSGNFEKLLEQMKENFDIILIDSPSVLSLADVPKLAVKCDGVLLVIHSKIGKKRIVKQAMSKLRFVHANVFGTVMNYKKRNEQIKHFSYYS